MLFENMNLFQVFLISTTFAFVYGAFCVGMIAVFEKIGDMINNRRRLINRITVDENGHITYQK
jgi:hypothetical protein